MSDVSNISGDRRDEPSGPEAEARARLFEDTAAQIDQASSRARALAHALQMLAVELRRKSSLNPAAILKHGAGVAIATEDLKRLMLGDGEPGLSQRVMVVLRMLA